MYCDFLLHWMMCVKNHHVALVVEAMWNLKASKYLCSCVIKTHRKCLYENFAYEGVKGQTIQLKFLTRTFRVAYAIKHKCLNELVVVYIVQREHEGSINQRCQYNTL
jgi:hypothetical protein